MSLGNVTTAMSNIFSRIGKTASASDTAPANPLAGTGNLKPISANTWQQVLANAVNGGGPVDDVKTYSDFSGSSGENDYFSALGYDA